jgi:SAM-dependent methyltransferase
MSASRIPPDASEAPAVGVAANGDAPPRPSAAIYESARLAEAYASARPPVHRAVVEARLRDVSGAVPVERLLDIGCGTGLSTAAVSSLARTVIGLEPSRAMLAHHARVAPQALFVAGRAEQLPFASGTFDRLTAAGSVNYVDTPAFYPEADRVLRPGGLLLIYDFSEGRRARGRDDLARWYDAFEARYPPPPGYALDLERVDFSRYGFCLERLERFEVVLGMTLTAYVAYVLSEAGVEAALVRGTPEAEIRAWCERTLDPVFDGSLEVLFDAYVAVVVRRTAPALDGSPCPRLSK